MAPLLISGIASIANTAIDAWSNAHQQKLAVEQAKFDSAFSKAMSMGRGPSLQQGPTAIQGLENQLRNAPEIRGILDAQDPSRPAALKVSAEGRVWLQVLGNQPSELSVSMETRELARQLNSALTVAAPAGMQSAASSLATLR
jgi:hypothetical protein